MSAVLVRAHVVEPHFLLSAPGLGLEEDRLLVVTLGTGVILCPWQSRIRDNVRNNMSQFAGRGYFIRTRYFKRIVSSYSISCIILFT